MRAKNKKEGKMEDERKRPKKKIKREKKFYLEKELVHAGFTRIR